MTRSFNAMPMPLWRSATMFAAAIMLSVISASPALAGECDERNPFKSARYAPPDVTSMLQVRGAAWLRHTLADRPIAAWLTGLVDAEALDQVWSDLAEQTGLPRGLLFDSLLGGRFAIFSREGEGDGPGEWALVADVHPYRLKKVFERLDPRVIGPAHGMTLSEIPEHQLLVARDGDSLVVGPKLMRALFDDVVARVGRGEEESFDTLAGTREIELAQGIGGGRVEVFVRHGGFIGGWSAVTANFEGDDVAIRHVARFDRSPFTGKITRLQVNPSLLDSFEDRSMLALALPADAGEGPLATFIKAKLGQPLLSQALERNRGDVQLISIGEVEGRLEPNQVDMLVPTFAICLELLDGANAEAQLDEHMILIARQIEKRAQGSFEVPFEELARVAAGEPRHVDLANAGDWLSGGFPMLRNITLNWAVAPGPDGSTYAVIASHPEQLKAAVASLATADDSGDPRRRLAHAGTFNGPRLGHHLLSYTEQVEQLVGPDAAEEMRQSLTMLSRLSIGIERARWSVTRPCETEMRLDAVIRLAPNPSATSTPEKRGKGGRKSERHDRECATQPSEAFREDCP